MITTFFIFIHPYFSQRKYFKKSLIKPVPTVWTSISVIPASPKHHLSAVRVLIFFKYIYLKSISFNTIWVAPLKDMRDDRSCGVVVTLGINTHHRHMGEGSLNQPQILWEEINTSDTRSWRHTQCSSSHPPMANNCQMMCVIKAENVLWSLWSHPS